MMDERKEQLEQTEQPVAEQTPAAQDELFQYDDPKAKKKRPKKEKDTRLRRGFMRKLMPLFVLLAAAVVLGSAYFILRSISPEDNGEDQVNTVEVLSLNATEVKTVTVVNTEDSYTLYKKSGSVYKIEGKEDKPVDEDVISTSIGYLSAIESTKKIMVAADKLKDYGLAAPAATVTLTTAKKEVELYVGSQSAGDEYYMYLKDDPQSKEGEIAVYLLSKTQSQVCLADHYYYYDTDISGYDSSEDAENITPVTIGGKLGTAVNVYMSDNDTGLAYVMDDPVNMPFSTSVMDSILSLLSTLNTATPVADDISDANLQKLGLYEPQYTLDFANNTEERTILFGNEDENGMIYCMAKGGQAIYQVSASAVECLGMDVADMCDVITYTRDVDTLNRILIKSQGKTYDIVTQGTGDERVVHVNNKAVESSIFSEFYAYLLGMEVQREGEKPAGDPYLTLEITLSEDGSKEVLNYYAVDERYCFYELNGKGMFYVSRQAVDMLLQNAQKVYNNEEIATAW